MPPAATAAVAGTGVDEASAESFPASDPVAPGTAGRRRRARGAQRRRRRRARPAEQPGARRRSPTASRSTIDHGHVAIAAITSCTNTSNPYVMVGAGLLAKNAVEKGLTSKPWVKTTLAPGSKVVTDYYEKAGLTPYLDKLGFQTVGYGCTTCIGNSGPLPEEVSAAVNEGDLAVVSVLSGNRNFEGRINPDIKMNYLASPPLVVAYALAGSMDVDITTEPLGQDADGDDVFLKDIWPSPQDVAAVVGEAITSEMYADVVLRRLRRHRPLEGHRGAAAATRSPGTPSRPTCASPRTSTACSASPSRSPTSPAPRCSPCSATRSRPTTSPPPATSARTRPPARTCRSTASSPRTSTATAHAAATTRS